MQCHNDGGRTGINMVSKAFGSVRSALCGILVDACHSNPPQLNQRLSAYYSNKCVVIKIGCINKYTIDTTQ